MDIKKLLIILVVLAGCNIPESYHKQEPMPANFKTINLSIFETRCVECHGPNKKANNVDLSSYEKIMSKDIFPPLVIPGNPERSSLYQSVFRNDEFTMPKGRQRLSNKELQAIYEWIKNGALKDEMPKPKKPDEPTESEPEPDPGSNEPGGSDEAGGNEPGRGDSSKEPG